MTKVNLKLVSEFVSSSELTMVVKNVGLWSSERESISVYLFNKGVICGCTPIGRDVVFTKVFTKQ